ncbi:MAG TPA: 1,4-dihydroxy-2-naphthoate octaprenyltransferase [Ignavibacteriales bacterium]|nr:1,4-dihydroxy-2-naphthoate octaprenyltransferase [Ignavibacteriales bacterium]
MNNLEKWILAARPKTLPAIISPVIVGNIFVMKQFPTKFNYLIGFVTLLSALLIQIGTNFVNDLYDFYKGSDTKERKGPIRVVSAGLVTPKQMQFAIYFVFTLAFVLGLILVYSLEIKYHKGLYLLVVGILSIIFAYIYTAGPFPLAYNGLGDISAIVFFGVIATLGSFFVHTGELNMTLFVISIALGMLIDNILVVNNYRDYYEDKKNNKRTLIVILGEKSGLYLYLFNNIFAIAILLIFRYTKLAPLAYYLFPFDIALLFLAIRNFVFMKKHKGVDLNILLGETSKYLLFYSFIMSINIIIGG